MSFDGEVKVGGEVEAYCTSCRQMGWHVVVAMVAGRPAKAECISCHKQHVYRAGPPGTPKPRAPSRATSARAEAAGLKSSSLAELEAKLAGREDSARVYAPREAYTLEEVIRHPSFGAGVVIALPAPQKMEVAFRDGRKFLVHDRAGAVPPKLTRPERREDPAGPSSGVTDAPPLSK